MFKKMFIKGEIDKIAQTIRDKYKPSKIFLFGSMARGDFREGSDIDMLIIKNSDKKRYERSVEVLNLLKDVDRKLPFGPLVMTSAEFARGVKENRYFFREILNNSKVLYEE